MQPKDLILNNGLKVPKLAYGTYLVEDKDIIKEAIKIGYRHIDGADVYGNQIIVGKVINECINEGLVKRKDLFITSKVCHTKFGWQRVQDCCKNSLKEMDLSYFDMYLLHEPFRDSEEWQNYVLDSWRGLEKLYRDGFVKSIGVSNFSVKHLRFLLEIAEVKPMINQMEIHPEHQNKEVVNFCKANDIALSSWGALNQGRIFKNPVFAEVAKKCQATPAQVAIKWNLEKGYIPIVTSHKKERIEANFMAYKIEIPKEEMKKLDALDGGAFSNWHVDHEPQKLVPLSEIKNLLSHARTVRYYLFGIPFLKVKDDGKGKAKYYLFGLPFLKKKTR